MSVINPSKALILLVGLLCITVLMLVEKLAASDGVPILTLVIGYAVGNGIAARSGTNAGPIIGTKE